ncbi:UvrD-helicase domain-containing protein [Roseovarius sp. W115]|uniref:DNA 3'-5' helicase II n=1 Tax=Roseovarius rhodophyticola TaxID=3080827 RepID=A0ABZ2THS3_9RHOB
MSSFDESEAAKAMPLSARAMAKPRHDYLADLNPAQREAVETLEGPVLMLAGAGTGKTKALMARVAHLITCGRARSDEILAVTFTNKAAKEMQRRLSRTPFELKEPIRWMGTFHAICVKLLRRHAELIGWGERESAQPVSEGQNLYVSNDQSDQGPYDLGPVPSPQVDEVPPHSSGYELHLKSNFTILDTDDQLRLLKQLVAAANIDDKRWPARQLAGIIDQWKNRAWTPDNVPASEASAYDGKGVALYAQYQRRLLELNAVDFGDLLLHMVTIFQTHDDVLAQYRRWFRYILVDEYQDTNVAQYLWLRLLAGGTKTSAAWAMMTSRSMAGAGQRWAISCGLKRIFRAHMWCGWSRIIVQPRISLLRRPV